MASGNFQNIYSPLSQNITDSDTEEEVHYTSTLKNLRNSFNNENSIENLTALPSPVSSTINDDERQNSITTQSTTNLYSTSKKLQPMSPERRFCFILSLFICLLAVILLIWVTPCNEMATCPAVINRFKAHNWLNSYTKIELKGIMNVVSGLKTWEKNLIFMYREDKIFILKHQKQKSGILSLFANSGGIAWYKEMKNEPVTVDCNLIDVDKNGKLDCIVLDEYGQLGAINPVSGEWLWMFTYDSSLKIDALNFPLILPDLNGDNIYELLLSTTDDKEKNIRNSIRIISGGTGKAIGNAYKLNKCEFINKLQLNEGYIGFNCLYNDKEIQLFKTIKELYQLITNNTLNKNLPIGNIPQHKLYGRRKETNSQRNIYSFGRKELIIDNKGTCPDNCNVTFTLTEESNVSPIIYFSSPMMYGMVPVSFKIKKENNYISGFIIKFWEWISTATTNAKHSKSFDNKRNSSSSLLPSSLNFDDRKIDLFEYDNFKFNSKRYKYFENNVTNLFETKNKTYFNNVKRKNTLFTTVNTNPKMRVIHENVILITFNSASGLNIENVSQSNIVQFCIKTNLSKNGMLCQPDLNYHENSIMISDLDHDKSQELISYYTTFVNVNDDNINEKWRLKSYVTLLRIESELSLHTK